MSKDEININDVRSVRLHKIKDLRENGINPYPGRFERTHTLSETTVLTEGDKDIRLAGRIMKKRDMGKITFLTIQDFSGQFQLVVTKDIGDEEYKLLQKRFDVGDFIGASGEIFVTKTGELSLLVKEFQLLGKALLPLPEKWHGVTDTETKYRKRYLDLIMNNDTKARFMKRSRIIRIMRKYLEDNGFFEVETPVLATKASGALAKPFKTHHNALDIDLYLRIAPETYLKRLVVGGYDKVFEFARCFRNEGLDPSHLQDFTMLEYYVSYWNYEDNMKFTEKLIGHVIYELNGSYNITVQGNEIDFTPPFPRYVFADLILKDSGIDINKFPDKKSLLAEIKNKKIDAEVDESMGLATIYDQLYKKVSRPKLIQPCFVIDHPSELKPLARHRDDNENIAESFQLLVNTWEIVNAYSELVDPVLQRKMLEAQAKAKAGGDDEAMELEEDYIECMEHGMPPISGWGMGIDRFTALLTDQDNLKDVVLFPLMRPLGASDKSDKRKKVSGKTNVSEDSTKSKGNIAKNKEDSSAGDKTNEDDEQDKITYDISISRADVWKYVQDNASSEMIAHLLSVESAMRALARHFDEDEEVWGIAGLLHDVDYTTGMSHEEHCGQDTQKRLMEDLKLPEQFVLDICAHNEAQGLPRRSLMAKVLYSVDELTGIIFAGALVRPEKKIADMKVKSVKKKFKDKSFAAKCDRALIRSCETEFDMPLEELMEITLEGMKEVAEEIGL